MKKQKLKQYAFIDAADLEWFEIKLNERMEELAGCDPQVEFYPHDPMLARISYSKEILVEEETPAERGARFTCGDCPLMRHIAKRDGTPDLRRAYGECDFGEMGRVYKTTPACDYLYKMIMDGRIRLKLEDEEESEASNGQR